MSQTSQFTVPDKGWAVPQGSCGGSNTRVCREEIDVPITMCNQGSGRHKNIPMKTVPCFEIFALPCETSSQMV